MRLRLEPELSQMREYHEIRPGRRGLEVPPVLEGGSEVNNNTRSVWPLFLDITLIITLITVAVIAIAGGRA